MTFGANKRRAQRAASQVLGAGARGCDRRTRRACFKTDLPAMDGKAAWKRVLYATWTVLPPPVCCNQLVLTAGLAVTTCV